MDWTQYAINNGLAVGLLAAIGIGGWRVVVFLAPLVKQFFERQIAFLDFLQENQKQQTTILEKHSERLDEIHERVNRCGANRA